MYKFENLQEFNNKYYKYLCDKNNNIYENKSLNLIHHIGELFYNLRLVLE